MDRFFKQLSNLADENGAMKKAVENIKKDCCSNCQPNGNITEKATQSIASDCRQHPEHNTGHLEKIIRDHRSISNPELYGPARPIQEKPLLRIVSLESLVNYHMLESFRGKNRLGKTYDKRSLYRNLKKDLLERLSDQNGEIEMEALEMEGSTGRPNCPTWWTFHGDEAGSPETGEVYMLELALGDSEINKAQKDNAVMEIAVAQETLPGHLFKPTALDAFDPETRFEPELTGKPHGRTVPIEPGTQPRPELVSASVTYRNLGKKTGVTLKMYPFRPSRKEGDPETTK